MRQYMTLELFTCVNDPRIWPTSSRGFRLLPASTTTSARNIWNEWNNNCSGSRDLMLRQIYFHFT